MLILRLAKLLVILLVTILMGADGSSINGFVRNDLDGEPISYANVFISNTSLGAATNRAVSYTHLTLPTILRV